MLFARAEFRPLHLLQIQSNSPNWILARAGEEENATRVSRGFTRPITARGCSQRLDRRNPIRARGITQMPQRPRTRPPSASATRPDDPPATSIPLPSEIGGQLLYDRDQARRLLRVSKSSLRRMERRGLLRPIRPTGSP